jgi:hypothetical protein
LKRSFKVSSRVKGKEKVLAFGVPRNLALSIGSRFAEFTTAKSFKIKQVGFTQQQDIVPTSLGQFRLPKRGKRVAREGYQFVEKNKFAINTIGEIRGLKAGKLFNTRNLL